MSKIMNKRLMLTLLINLLFYVVLAMFLLAAYANGDMSPWSLD